ncbi:MAG: asparagine synthase (glutamine-hydrolyzing) [Candidatus Omnitrophota bacterium]|nr:asparagine synthase (glutamine-hydrolyzing) [Candidatus Omnitrophota bacterium]
MDVASMCGICGVVNFQGEPVTEALLASMAGRLRHRGPDAVGIARPEGWAGLGHTRLKVIDLSERANQPMVSQDGRVWVVYNGEVYNYRDLRALLQGYGHRFVSASDTEVILQAYEQWGEECIARLDGMFALAIFDGRRQRLLLARDRTGKKPLFYYRNHERLVFASEIKALLVHPSVPCEFHEGILPRYLTYGYVPPPETFYANIRALPPASLMVVDLPDGRERQRTYWQLPLPEQSLRVPRHEAIQGLRERLTEAVRKRLVSDVPLGASLSGGIDSTIVVGLMSRLTGQPIHTFSIGFHGDSRYDETPFARLVAQQFQTRHTEFMVEPKAFDLLERLVYHHDQPFGDASAIPTFLLCALTKEHVTVALNGDGGDECFAGYRRFQAAAASARMPRWFSRALGRSLASLPAGIQQRRQVGELIRFFTAAQRPWDERLARWISYFPEPSRLLRPELRARVPEDDWLVPARRWLAQAQRCSPLTQALYFNFQEYLPNDLHVKMDRCSMAHGLETRSPFLDTEVIEYAARLPDAMKLRGWTTKAILKEAFADLLPPAIVRRPKQGFGVPLDAWFRTDLRDAVSELLLSPGARLAAYLEPQAIRDVWQTHLRGDRNMGLQLWNLLTLEMWLRMCARHVWTSPSPEPAAVVQHGASQRAPSWGLSG